LRKNISGARRTTIAVSALTCAAIAAASSAAVASATTPRLARQNVRNASTKTLQIDAVIADGADPF
jgi:hypothetical protein